MTAKEALASIKNLLKAKFGEESAEQFEASKLSDGTVIEVSKLEAGGDFVIVAADGTKSPAPAGEYELEDARILVVTEPGKIAEIKEKTTEEEPKEEPAQNEMVAALSLQVAELQRTVASQAGTIAGLQTSMQTFKADTNSVLTSVVGLVEQIASEETEPPVKEPKQTVFSDHKKKKDDAKKKSVDAFAAFREKLKEKQK